jgi:hypothetical protein
MSDPSDGLTAQLLRLQKRLDDLARQNEEVIRECATVIQTVAQRLQQLSLSKRPQMQ